MKLLITLSLSMTFLVSCNQKKQVVTSVDSNVLQVVSQKMKVCKTSYNCIKPVDIKGTKVKALEIKIHSTAKASFVTYDKLGNPVDLEDEFVIQIRATKEPATLDADVIKK